MSLWKTSILVWEICIILHLINYISAEIQHQEHYVKADAEIAAFRWYSNYCFNAGFYFNILQITIDFYKLQVGSLFFLEKAFL